MAATTVIIVISVFACYIWWFLALGIMRKAQFELASETNTKYDNVNPRAAEALLGGYGARARNAMNNHSEQFGFFAAAAALVLIVKKDMEDTEAWALAGLAIAYAATRLFHVIFYISNQSSMRSVVFGIGLGCLVAMYVIAISAAAAN